MLLPHLNGEIAMAHRRQMRHSLIRYYAGDMGLVPEIAANAASTAPLNALAREEMVAAGAAVPDHTIATSVTQLVAQLTLQTGTVAQLTAERDALGMLVAQSQSMVAQATVERDALGEMVLHVTEERDRLGVVASELALERQALRAVVAQVGAERDALGSLTAQLQGAVAALDGGLRASAEAAMRELVVAAAGRQGETMLALRAVQEQCERHMLVLRVQWAERETRLLAQIEELKQRAGAAAEQAKKAALGDSIKISEVARELGFSAPPNSEAWVKIGAALKKRFMKQMGGAEPGFAAREYNAGDMVACAYFRRDTELVKAVVRDHFAARRP